MAIKISNDVVIDDSKKVFADSAVFSGTTAITLPRGTTAQQPGTAVAGMIRYNTDKAAIEVYTGAEWENYPKLSAGKLYFLSTLV